MSGLILLLTLSIVIQIAHWYFIFLPVTDRAGKKRMESRPSLPLSVIICFHKEWGGIPAVLQRMQVQSYAAYELILVNDGPVMMNREHLHWIHSKSNITYLEHQKSGPGKKGALRAGIEAASCDWLVMTDIDCLPGTRWLGHIVENLPSEPSILLGYGPYFGEQGIVGFMVQQETILTAAQYMGWANAGFPYMGVGRNLICHRTVYDETTFETHDNIPSGDDDLFVNEAAGRFPVMLLTSPETFVYSAPPANLKQWWRQKTRHMSTGKYYALPSKIRISLFSFSLAAEKLMLLILLFSGDLKNFLLFVLLKGVLIIFPLYRIYQLLDKGSHFLRMWIYEWLHVFYLTLVSPWIFFKTKKEWE